MLARLRDRFLWPRMGEGVKWYVQTCHECQVQQMKKIHIPPTVPHPGYLFWKIYINVMHMLALKGFKFILHARCSLSVELEYVVLKKQTANAVAEFLMKTQCRFGGLFEMVTDNAVEPQMGPLRDLVFMADTAALFSFELPHTDTSCLLLVLHTLFPTTQLSPLQFLHQPHHYSSWLASH